MCHWNNGFNFPILFIFKRNLLVGAHKVAHGAVRGACAEGGPSISGQGGEMLLMVEKPKDFLGSETAVLRSINELQPSGTVNHAIPYVWGCAYTLLQGEPAKSCLCSSLLFLSMLNPSLGGQLL